MVDLAKRSRIPFYQSRALEAGHVVARHGHGYGYPPQLGIGWIFRGVFLDVTFSPEHTDVMQSTHSLKPATASDTGGRTHKIFETNIEIQ